MVESVQRDGLGRIQANSSSSFKKYGFVLVFIKIIRCIGLFELNDLLKSIHVIQLLFLIQISSAGIYLLLQKPFSTGNRLNKKQWSYILQHAILGILTNLLWLIALTLCGPLRTILVYEHGEPILIAMFVGIFSSNRKGNHARTRGSLMFFLGILCLLIFDNDDVIVKVTNHPEGQHTSSISHAIYLIISYLGVADHKGGIVLLVFTLFLKVTYSGYTKRVGAHVGGVKRLHALSTFLSGLLLWPWAVLLYFAGFEMYLFSHFLVLLFVMISVFVISHYGQSIALSNIDSIQVARLGYFAISLFALFLGFQWSHPAAMAISNIHGSSATRTEEHVISGGVIVSAIFFILASDILSWPTPKSQKGSFIGYSAEGLPLYRFAGDVLSRASKSSFGALTQGFLRRVLEERDSRHIFYFLCINLGFAFVELTWGIWSNSLGLISDSFHMLFDCTALVLGLIAAVMAKWKSTRIFPYGYGRVEVLSGFVNGLFLLVIALFLFLEAFQRLIDPPNINTDKLLAVSISGLLVNLVGVFVFSHQHHSHTHGTSSHLTPHDKLHHHHDHHHSHRNTNIKGVYLHVLADLLGSVGVIVSSFLVGRWQILIADPLCTLFVASLILTTVWPLLRDSARILAMCASPELKNNVHKALAKSSNIEGVISHRLCRVWQHTDDETVAVVNVYVEPHIIEQRIISQVQGIFREYGINSTTVQVEKDDFYQHMSGMLSGPDEKLQPGISSYPQMLQSHYHSTGGEYTKLV